MSKIYRYAVFALALGYTIRMVVFSDYVEPLGPFRYLTIWALLFSLVSAWLMLRRTLGLTDRRFETWVSVTTVLNAMVVFLYWKLYFADPTSVTRDGQLGAFYLEMYLHALGPALQWVDALFIHRGFKRPAGAAVALVVVIAAYVGWAEFVVQPLNTTPVGTVTNGLPYPFLNDLELVGRMVFYGANAAVSLVFLAGFCALAWGVRRVTATP